MLILKKTIILLLIICLSGCSKIILPTVKDQERCVLSLKYNKCSCHQYRVSKDTVGRVGETVHHSIEHCENLVGFSPMSFIEYVLFFEEVFKAAEDANTKGLVRPKIETENEILDLVLDAEK